jgi:anti-anti-sigma factor
MALHAGRELGGELPIDRARGGDRGQEEIVAPRGEVDLASRTVLQDALRVAAGSGCEVVVVDLRNVTFLDSSGMAVLIAAHREIGASGQRLVVRGATTALRRLFRIAGVDEYLNLEH